jgi:hypothetical protein
MSFDEASYVVEFIKKLRGARSLPDDLLARYAITLPAADAEIAAQVKGVRNYWNKTYQGASTAAQVARMCRAEDERLRAQYGKAMETRAWWDKQQSARQSEAEKSIAIVAGELRQKYGQFGVVTSGIVEKFATQLGLASGQAAQAVERAGLTMVSGFALPDAEPIASFTALLKNMSECGAPSVPDLVHPGAGPYRIVERYTCLADPARRLDAIAVERQIAEADKRGISATEDARRSALKILRRAVKDGVDLRDVTLFHLIAVARDPAALSIGVAVSALAKAELEQKDAAVIAVLLTEQAGGSGGSGVGKVQSLLETGRLREAIQAAQSLPADSEGGAEAAKLVAAARERLDTLLAKATAAAEIPDEVQATTLLKEAAGISAEDAEERLTAVPLPPPASLRAVCDEDAVKLYWRPAAGHDPDTTYAVRRGEQRPPAAPEDGAAVYRGPGDSYTDERAPVARTLQYSVFACDGGNRPASRPVTASVTLLPPVSQLKASVEPAAITLHWTSPRDARQVRVTRSEAGGTPRSVPVTGSSCRVTGLTEGQPQHFEVIAVYQAMDGTEQFSAAEVVNETPRSQAKPIPKLRSRPVQAGDAVHVQLSWTRVDQSEVRIMRSDSPPTIAFGTWVSPEQMQQAGQEVAGRPIGSEPEISMEAELPPGVHYLVPFSIGGTGIVAGRSTMIAVTDPVRHLVVTPFTDYATVSWEWPSSAELAEVAWELDGEMDSHLISRGEYRSKGGARVPLGRGPCRIEVRAVIMVGNNSFTAPPVETVIDNVVDVEIGYTVSALSLGPFGGRSKKVVFIAAQGCKDVQIRMIASPGVVMPTSATAGVPVLEEALSLPPGVPVEHHVTVPRAVKRPYWVRCFVTGGRGRLIDPPISCLKEA